MIMTNHAIGLYLYLLSLAWNTLILCQTLEKKMLQIKRFGHMILFLDQGRMLVVPI
jgi:hypothetical protein